MSTASSVRKPYVPPSQPNPHQPTNTTAVASSSSSKQLNGAGNAVSQVQGSTRGAPAPAAAAPVKSSLATSSSSSSSAAAAVPPFAAGLANLLAIKKPLPVSDRSWYKTFILTNGVFEIESRYIMKETIGQGAYGVVCSAFDLQKNCLVAVKKIENVFDHRSLAKRTLRELMIVRQLQHENVLGIERVIRPHNAQFANIYMISELMETDLACVIRSPQDLTDEHVQFFVYQVLRGLKFIHSADVIHRDLKPRNLLVNSNCDLKICDFGLARVDDPQHRDRCTMSNYIATRWYRAPEVILGRKRYTKAVDMWSVGCILAELIGRKPIFPGRDSFHQITLICSILGTPGPSELKSTSQSGMQSNGPQGSKGAGISASTTPAVNDEYISALPRKTKVPFRQLYPHASALACDLLDKLLVFEPEKRLTVGQALSHPYLEELHCADDEPSCTNFDYSSHYFEYLKTSKEDLRYLIHKEIVENYPEERFDHKSPQAIANARAAGFGAQVDKQKDGTAAGGDPLNAFAKQMAGALPKGKKVRRKSI